MFDTSKNYDERCILITAKVYVPAESSLEHISVSSQSLDIQLDQSLDVSISGAAIETISGDLTSQATKLNSRETFIYTVSGNIEGSFNMLDTLSFKTKSGTINTIIAPKEADKRYPDTPAEFSSETVSGTTTLKFLTDDLPDREYNSNIASTSGSISGTFLYGGRLDITTISGTLTADLFVTPGSSTQVRTFHQVSKSGSVRVTVLPSDHELGILNQNLETISGTLEVKYPETWEGKFHATSMSGTLSAEGHGVRIVKDSKGFTGHELVAKKGDGDSQTIASSISGTIGLAVGL
jgi:DUF4097 and DUF4098 domain-containing protein YvlB